MVLSKTMGRWAISEYNNSAVDLHKTRIWMQLATLDRNRSPYEADGNTRQKSEYNDGRIR